MGCNRLRVLINGLPMVSALGIRKKSVASAIVVSSLVVVPATVFLSITQAISSYIDGEFSLRSDGGAVVFSALFSFVGIIFSALAVLVYLLRIPAQSDQRFWN